MYNTTIFDEINKFFSTPATYNYVEQSQRSSIYNTDDTVVVEVDLPGFGKENIKMDIDDGHLVIDATRKSDDGEGTSFYRKNVSRKNYKERFKLLSGLDVDNISASYVDGVLSVTIPKTEDKKPKAIEIK